jgi:hypothetical protein
MWDKPLNRFNSLIDMVKPIYRIISHVKWRINLFTGLSHMLIEGLNLSTGLSHMSIEGLNIFTGLSHMSIEG